MPKDKALRKGVALPVPREPADSALIHQGQHNSSSLQGLGPSWNEPTQAKRISLKNSAVRKVESSTRFELPALPGATTPWFSSVMRSSTIPVGISGHLGSGRSKDQGLQTGT